MKRLWLGLILIISIAALSSCAGPRMLMQTAPSTPKATAASPPITAQSRADWLAQKPNILTALETHVYGVTPPITPPLILEQSLTPFSAFDGTARAEELMVQFSPNGIDSAPVPVVILTPHDADGPVPLILMQNFCPNHNVIPLEQLTKPVGNHIDCSGEGFKDNLFGYFFGRYITTPPIEHIMERGYGLAVIHPPQFVPDRRRTGRASLASYDAPDWGTIGAWSWQTAALAQYFQTDTRFSDIIAYGHSRYGKSALLAAALSPAIDGVVSHQSGTGGASLSRNKKGETVQDITERYPHWFTPQYMAYSEEQSALPIDQHHLLAMIAPRPVLLGNARRDVWSDPEGGFRAAQGATPIYQLYGESGLSAQKLTQFQPADSLAFWMRPGTHGVTKEDWPSFLSFLDAHFK